MEPTGWTPKRIGLGLLFGIGGPFLVAHGIHAIVTQHDEWYRRGGGGPVDGAPAVFGGILMAAIGLVFAYAGIMIFLGRVKLPP